MNNQVSDDFLWLGICRSLFSQTESATTGFSFTAAKRPSDRQKQKSRGANAKNTFKYRGKFERTGLGGT